MAGPISSSGLVGGRAARQVNHRGNATRLCGKNLSLKPQLAIRTGEAADAMTPERIALIVHLVRVPPQPLVSVQQELQRQLDFSKCEASFHGTASLIFQVRFGDTTASGTGRTPGGGGGKPGTRSPRRRATAMQIVKDCQSSAFAVIPQMRQWSLTSAKMSALTGSESSSQNSCCCRRFSIASSSSRASSLASSSRRSRRAFKMSSSCKGNSHG